MKKLFISAAITAVAVVSANAAWITSTSDGDWDSASTWNAGAVPNDTYDGVNIGQNTSVYIDSAVPSVKTMFLKNNSTLIFKEGASLTILTGNTMNFDGTGITLKFLGGSYTTATNINGKGNFTFGGTDSSSGDFVAAVAKSVNSTARLLMQSDTLYTYNLAASNLLTEKTAGQDSNAILYTTGEIQQMQTEFLLDFTNITVDSLAASGISDSGTYYVALASWGVTYKTVGGDEFTPVLSSASHDTDLVSFGGFEWGNGTSKNNNTLYAVLNVNVPEPATYAAIFGALALAFAAYRRRK